MNITKGIMLPKTSMKSTEKNGQFTRQDNLMVVVHEKIIPAKEEPDKRLMSYSIITTNHNNSSKHQSKDYGRQMEYKKVRGKSKFGENSNFWRTFDA